MTVGRTSTSSPALTRALAIILLAGILPGVKACWIDDDGIEHCSNFSPAARIGIGLGLFVIVLVLLSSLTVMRRRRAARANLAYIQQQQGGVVPVNGYAAQPAYAPQYPPQAYGAQPYMYDPNSGFAPPGGSPPQYYPPPVGAPPVDQSKVPYHV